jgi:hypothetical protein
LHTSASVECRCIDYRDPSTLVVANYTNVQGNDPYVQLACGQVSTIIGEAKDADPRRHNGTFAMIDSVAAVLSFVSSGIFLAHAIENYHAYAFVGAEARFTMIRFAPISDPSRACYPLAIVPEASKPSAKTYVNSQDYDRNVMERSMGEVVRLVSKSERERIRLIREARAIYDNIFPPADLISEQRERVPTIHGFSGANSPCSEGGLQVIKIIAVLCSLSSPTNCYEQTVTTSDFADVSVQSCMMGPPQLADWMKEHPAECLAGWRCAIGKREGRGI